jgi:hypothetical protein
MSSLVVMSYVWVQYNFLEWSTIEDIEHLWWGEITRQWYIRCATSVTIDPLLWFYEILSLRESP